MKIAEMHVWFRQYAQQMGMQNVRAILPEQIDTLINTSIRDTIDEVINRNVGITNDRIITDNAKIASVNALRTLYKVKTLNVLDSQNLGSYKLEPYVFDSSSVGSALYFVDFSIRYTKNNPSTLVSLYTTLITKRDAYNAASAALDAAREAAGLTSFGYRVTGANSPFNNVIIKTSDPVHIGDIPETNAGEGTIEETGNSGHGQQEVTDGDVPSGDVTPAGGSGETSGETSGGTEGETSGGETSGGETSGDTPSGGSQQSPAEETPTVEELTQAYQTALSEYQAALTAYNDAINSAGFTRWFPIRVVDDSYLADIINDWVLAPRMRTPAMVVYARDNSVVESQFELYLGENEETGIADIVSDYYIGQIRCSYIKEPNKVKYLSDINGQNVDSDLPEQLQIPMLKHAVDLYRASIQGSLFAAQQNQQQNQQELVRNNSRPDNEGYQS